MDLLYFFILSFLRDVFICGTCNLLERKATTVKSTTKINRSIQQKKNTLHVQRTFFKSRMRFHYDKRYLQRESI